MSGLLSRIQIYIPQIVFRIHQILQNSRYFSYDSFKMIMSWLLQYMLPSCHLMLQWCIDWPVVNMYYRCRSRQTKNELRVVPYENLLFLDNHFGMKKSHMQQHVNTKFPLFFIPRSSNFLNGRTARSVVSQNQARPTKARLDAMDQ